MTASALAPALSLVVCAAPPARAVDELVELFRPHWRVCVFATPRAARWLSTDALAEQIGNSVRHRHEELPDLEALPPADVVAVVPATFNTINKWVVGISDTLALGILNESIGLGLPIIAVPHAKPSLARHPVFERNLATLSSWGVHVMANEVLRQPAAEDTHTFNWLPVVHAVNGPGRRS